jgi:hypothetical protein
MAAKDYCGDEHINDLPAGPCRDQARIYEAAMEAIEMISLSYEMANASGLPTVPEWDPTDACIQRVAAKHGLDANLIWQEYTAIMYGEQDQHYPPNYGCGPSEEYGLNS